MSAQQGRASGGVPAPTRGRLPNFLVIGAAKAGTTSLAAWLRVHPQAFVPDQKEIHFFDIGWERGATWYREQFAGAGDDFAVGEASPTYLYHRDAPDRVAGLLPDVKLIALLRHPVDRAWSHYWYEQRNGREDRSFEDAVEEELQQGSRPGPRFSYLGQGRYAEQLARWEERFGRDRMHVALFDDLDADPHAVFSEVCGFLGIDPETSPGNVGKVYNANYRLRSPRLRLMMYRYRLWKRLPFRLGYVLDRLNQAPLDYPQMDPGLRSRLVEELAPDNAALGAWLGRPIPPGWDR